MDPFFLYLQEPLSIEKSNNPQQSPFACFYIKNQNPKMTTKSYMVPKKYKEGGNMAVPFSSHVLCTQRNISKDFQDSNNENFFWTDLLGHW